MEFTIKMLQDHVKSGKTSSYGGYDSRSPAKGITCKDGFKVSVQASDFHYCRPRNLEGPYSAFELGFPSEKEERLMPYVENADDPTGTVYSNVPLFTVIDLINSHGGMPE